LTCVIWFHRSVQIHTIENINVGTWGNILFGKITWVSSLGRCKILCNQWLLLCERIF
jgi:hypothetical protein